MVAALLYGKLERSLCLSKVAIRFNFFFRWRNLFEDGAYTQGCVGFGDGLRPIRQFPS